MFELSADRFDSVGDNHSRSGPRILQSEQSGYFAFLARFLEAVKALASLSAAETHGLCKLFRWDTRV